MLSPWVGGEDIHVCLFGVYQFSGYRLHKEVIVKVNLIIMRFSSDADIGWSVSDRKAMGIQWKKIKLLV